MSRTIIGAGIALLAIPALSAGIHPHAVPREAEFGARSVIYNLAVLKSTSVRKARQRCVGYCGDEAGSNIEAVIGLLGVGGHATTQSLTNLLSAQLDAGGAEELDCQLAKRGRALVPALQNLKAPQAASWCRRTFDDLRKGELVAINDVSAEQVCRPAAAIDSDRREWIAALQSGQNLFAESGPC